MDHLGGRRKGGDGVLNSCQGECERLIGNYLMLDIEQACWNVDTDILIFGGCLSGNKIRQ